MHLNRIKLMILLIAGSLLFGCQASTEQCWVALERQYYAMSVLNEQNAVSSGRGQEVRADIRQILGDCRAIVREPRYLELVGPNESAISIVDMAIIADDGEFLAQYSSREELEAAAGIGEHELLYGGSFMLVAAEFDSRRAITSLLELGIDVNQHDENGFTALHIADGTTDDGLHTIAFLVLHGASVDAVSAHGVDPLEMAVLENDSRKYSCLRAMHPDTDVDGSGVPLGLGDSQSDPSLRSICVNEALSRHPQ